jgi:hypothetical protein
VRSGIGEKREDGLLIRNDVMRAINHDTVVG